MASEREKALARDAEARSRLAADPSYRMKQARGLAPERSRAEIEAVWSRSELRGVLTLRELEVLQLLADGKSTREVGATLFIGVQTVKSHVSSILGKLIANDRAHAVAIGFRERLIK
jgi:DNA-binding NarL/FixJ family response regulator